MFDISFEKDWNQYDISIKFVLEVIRMFVDLATKTVDVQLTKKAPIINDEQLFELSKKTPFTNGCEFVNVIWLKNLWKDISDYFEK